MDKKSRKITRHYYTAPQGVSKVQVHPEEEGDPHQYSGVACNGHTIRVSGDEEKERSIRNVTEMNWDFRKNTDERESRVNENRCPRSAWDR